MSGATSNAEEDTLEGTLVTHQLVEVPKPTNGQILCTSGSSESLERNTRIVSDRIVFVDNIPYFVSKEEFCDLMKEYAVRAPIIDVKFLKRTKGGSFAFLEFQNEEDGREAIESINQREFHAKNGKKVEIRASVAENPTESVSNKNLYVKGIPKHWDNDDLLKMFREYGTITHCRTLKKNEGATENTGVGFVHYQNCVDAARAIENMDDKPVDPTDESLGKLEVKWARAKRRGENRRRGGKKYKRNNREYDRRGPGWNRNMKNGNRGRGNRNNRNNGYYQMNNSNEEIWAKMVELMQNMSMWQTNSYNPNFMWQQSYPQQNNGQPQPNAGIDTSSQQPFLHPFERQL